MKKQLLVIGVAILFFGIGLSGCINEKTSDKNGGNTGVENRFIGSWSMVSNTSQNATWSFYTNGTCKMKFEGVGPGALSWYTYDVVNSTKICFTEIPPPVNQSSPVCYDYKFSSDYSSFTVSYEENVAKWVKIN